MPVSGGKILLPVSFVQHPKAQQEAGELRSGSGKGDCLVQRLCGLARIPYQEAQQDEIDRSLAKGEICLGSRVDIGECATDRATSS